MPTKWRCTICGHIYQGDKLPDVCPGCHYRPKVYSFIAGDRHAAELEKARVDVKYAGKMANEELGVDVIGGASGMMVVPYETPAMPDWLKEALEAREAVENYATVDAVAESATGGHAAETSAGQHVTEFGEHPVAKPGLNEIDASGPFVAYNPQLCVSCETCVYICNLIGAGILHVEHYPGGSRIVTDAAQWKDSSCIRCGGCYARCPMKAIVRIKY